MGTTEEPGPPHQGVGARGILLVAAAFLVGIVLLNRFDSGSGPFTPDVDVETGTTTTRRQPTVTAQATTTLRQPRPPADVRVLPANGTNTTGLGARTNEFLRKANYNALAPIDASRVVDTSIVAYRAEFEPEARVLAQLLQLPLSAVRPLDDSTPVPETRGADVVVVAGADLRLPA
jgi:hypothetical protein